MNFSQAVELFLLEDRAPSTNAAYRKALLRAADFFGTLRDIDLVTREDVLRYIQHLREQPTRYENHPRRPAERGGLSPRTIEKHVKTLITFFRWLQRYEYLAHNPAADLHLRRYKRPHGSSRAATAEELQAMLHIAQAKASLGRPKHLAILLFLADTGCRAGEAASLLIGNLDLVQKGAWVYGKGDKCRPVFFGGDTADALRAWLDVHPVPTAHETFFQMTSDSLSQVISRLAKAAGIERPIGAHAIRHRVGQVWATARMGEQATQLKLGHENSAVTIEMYYNTTYDHVQQASNELSLAAIYGLPSEPTGFKRMPLRAPLRR